jgi:hypothetical protein
MSGGLRFVDAEVDVDFVLLLKSGVDVSPVRYSVSVCSLFRSPAWLFSNAFSAVAGVRGKRMSSTNARTLMLFHP